MVCGTVKQIEGTVCRFFRNSYRTDLFLFFFFLATTAEGMGIDVMDPSTVEKFDRAGF